MSQQEIVITLPKDQLLTLVPEHEGIGLMDPTCTDTKPSRPDQCRRCCVLAKGLVHSHVLLKVGE